MTVACLRPGEPIVVVATGGPISRERLDAGLDAIRRWGHPVETGACVLKRRGFLAGSDAERAADLNAAIRRRDAAAILFARGGWGTARLLDAVDLSALRARPRVLLGYSDLTSLFMALQRQGRPYPYRYGPVVSELGQRASFDAPTLREALYLPERTITHSLAGRKILRSGRGAGTLIGGCLTLLTGLLGTPYDVSWDGCVLFWEDVNEPPYRIDRMLHQLRLAGKLANLKGMIVGRLAGSDAVSPTPGWPLARMILEATEGTRYPIVMNFPCGHIPRKRTLLMGVPAGIDTHRSRIVIHAGE